MYTARESVRTSHVKSNIRRGDSAWYDSVITHQQHVEDQSAHTLKLLEQRSIRRAKENAGIVEEEKTFKRRYLGRRHRPEHTYRPVF